VSKRQVDLENSKRWLNSAQRKQINHDRNSITSRAGGRSVVYAILLVMLITVAACGSSPKSSSNRELMTPEATIRSFFHALARQQIAVASTFVDRSDRSRIMPIAEEGPDTLISMRLLASDSQGPGVHRTYQLMLRHSVSIPGSRGAGIPIRGTIVISESSDGAWKIIDLSP